MDAGRQIDRSIGEFLILFAFARHRSAEHLYQRCAHKRGRNIGTVVDIVKKPAVTRSEFSACQIDRVNVQQQCSRGFFIRYFGIKNVCVSEAQFKALSPIRVFMQEKPQILRLLSGVCYC